MHIDKATIELSTASIEELGLYKIASALLNALNCFLGGQKYINNESLYEQNIIDTVGDRFIIFYPDEICGCKNPLYVNVSIINSYMLVEQDTLEEQHTHINITEFIPELIAEINDELDFWSESNEEHKDVLVHLMKRLMELFGNKLGLN